MNEIIQRPKYQCFQDLPNHVRIQVQRWGEPDSERWVLQPIPALGHRSIIDVMNLPDGERLVLEFLRDLQGMLS